MKPLSLRGMITMRRDPNLIRELMLRLEQLPMRPGGGSRVLLAHHYPVEGYTVEEVAYHLNQIQAERFINPGHQSMSSSHGISFQCLTPAGHDFIDSVRNPETWTKTKGVVEKAGGFTLSVLAETAKALIKHELQRIGMPL